MKFASVVPLPIFACPLVIDVESAQDVPLYVSHLDVYSVTPAVASHPPAYIAAVAVPAIRTLLIIASVSPPSLQDVPLYSLVVFSFPLSEVPPTIINDATVPIPPCPSL